MKLGGKFEKLGENNGEYGESTKTDAFKYQC